MQFLWTEELDDAVLAWETELKLRFRFAVFFKPVSESAGAPTGECQHDIFSIANDVVCRRQSLNEYDNASELRATKGQNKSSRCSTTTLPIRWHPKPV